MKEVVLHGAKAAGRVALVDDEDYEFLAQYRWTVWEVPEKHWGPYALAKIGVGRKAPKKYMHQLLTGWPLTDHENHNGLDNQRRNLRPATRRQNLANQRPMRGASRYKGVYLRRDTSRWQAQIKTGDRHLSLGCFDTDIEAALAYDVAARQHFGEFACPNFPEGYIAMVEFHMGGPHSPDSTREAADLVAEGVRYLNYATLGDAPGLKYPGDAYSLLGALYTATGRMPQLASQVSTFLNAQFDAGRLADDRGHDPLPAICKASAALGDAEAAASRLTQALQSAQNAIAGLAAKEDGDA